MFQPGHPAHLLYGVKFLHLPLYGGDGDRAVEGLLSMPKKKKKTTKKWEEGGGRRKEEKSR